MTVKNIDSRTYFHHRGANDSWSGSNLHFQNLPIKIFHLGYLLLLKSLDQPDDKYGTCASKLLREAQSAGIKTSIDTVTLYSPELFRQTVVPALKYTNFCIINEIEAQNVSGV